MERTGSNLAFISRLIDPEAGLDKHGLVATGNFQDLFASEKSRRLGSSYKALVLNVRGCIPMNGLRYHFLSASVWPIYHV